MNVIYVDKFQIDIVSESSMQETDDQDEFVSLPDVNEEKNDDYYFGADPTLWNNSNSDDDLKPNTSPLYQNQMGDPNVQAAYDDWINNFE